MTKTGPSAASCGHSQIIGWPKLDLWLASSATPWPQLEHSQYVEASFGHLNFCKYFHILNVNMT